MSRVGTVLAVPQIRVSARWLSRLRVASIEVSVTGIAGAADFRRHLMRIPANNTTPPRSVLMRLLVRSREYVHPHVWARVRVACGVFNLGLGVLLLASGHWLGPLAWLGVLPLAGAALIFWTAYHLRTSVQS